MKYDLYKNSYLKVDWPAPSNIKAFCTTRIGGSSLPPFDSFNLANHVEDQSGQVVENRNKLKRDLGLNDSPVWLEQIHSCNLINLDLMDEQIENVSSEDKLQADASFTTKTNKICTVMTADCLPLLLCNKQGNWIAAVHAGWRGLGDGILEKTIETYTGNSSDLLAWVGPAISQSHFEVGEEVKDEFTKADTANLEAFISLDDNKYLCDMYLIARKIFNRYNIESFGGDRCSFAESSLFYSYRRDGQTGRMASLIWIDDEKKFL